MKEFSEQTKKIYLNISKIVGIPFEELIKMDEDEVTKYIEQKNGKKLGYSKPSILHTGSGDDSVLIDLGRYRTIEEVDKKMDEVIKKHKAKSKTIQSKSKDNEDEDVLNK